MSSEFSDGGRGVVGGQGSDVQASQGQLPEKTVDVTQFIQGALDLLSSVKALPEGQLQDYFQKKLSALRNAGSSPEDVVTQFWSPLNQALNAPQHLNEFVESMQTNMSAVLGHVLNFGPESRQLHLVNDLSMKYASDMNRLFKSLSAPRATHPRREMVSKAFLRAMNTVFPEGNTTANSTPKDLGSTEMAA